MTPERIKEVSRNYHRAMEEVEEVLASAMCETYYRVTGLKAGDKLYEAIVEAVRYNK